MTLGNFEVNTVAQYSSKANVFLLENVYNAAELNEDPSPFKDDSEVLIVTSKYIDQECDPIKRTAYLPLVCWVVVELRH